jgi:hypothetical protein
MAVAVSRPTPGIDNGVVHAGDWRASALNSRSSCAMRTSSSRISSTSNVMVPRFSVGTAAWGSASARPICSTPRREPWAITMPNARQKPRSALMREVRVPKQAHLDTKTIEPARPVVRRAAGFHHH